MRKHMATKRSPRRPLGAPLSKAALPIFVAWCLTLSQPSHALATTAPLPPHAGYHGGTALPGRPFFEGWYLRVAPTRRGSPDPDCDPNDPNDGGPHRAPGESGGGGIVDGPLAFIHHVFDPHLPTSKRRGVGTQILTPLGSVFLEGPYDPATFRADSHDLSLRNDFSFAVDDGGGDGDGDGEYFELTASRARGRASSTDDNGNGETTTLVVEYDFSIASEIGWGGGRGDRQYSVAGWLSALPLFDPHYQVLISRGKASGYVNVSLKSTDIGKIGSGVVDAGDGYGDKVGWDEGDSTLLEERRYDLEDAAVYLEKNWGGTFPSRWWWMQANAFPTEPSLSVTSTGAIRALLPLVGGEEDVALVGVHWDGSFLPFPVVDWSVRWGSWVVRGTYEDYVVTLLGHCGEEEMPVPVQCPTPDGMREAALETYHGELRLVLRRRVGGPGGMFETLVDATTSDACLEVGGREWFKNGGRDEWEGRSAMAEPLKSVVMNVELERKGADALQLLKKFVEIPGL